MDEEKQDSYIIIPLKRYNQKSDLHILNLTNEISNEELK